MSEYYGNFANLSYVNVYQVGGIENFEWKEALPVTGYQAAVKQKEEILKMGYPCLTYRLDHLLEDGLPTDYMKYERRTIG